MAVSPGTKVTGYHRKAIIRLLHRVNQPNVNRKRGRPSQYSAAVVGVLRIAWEATDLFSNKFSCNACPNSSGLAIAS